MKYDHISNHLNSGSFIKLSLYDKIEKLKYLYLYFIIKYFIIIFYNKFQNIFLMVSYSKINIVTYMILALNLSYEVITCSFSVELLVSTLCNIIMQYIWLL